MSGSTLSADRNIARRRAWSQANRVTFAVAVLAWALVVVFHFAARTGWEVLFVLVPTVGLIWHGTYLHFKRQAACAERSDAPGPARQTPGRPGDHKAGGSFTLLLP